jgi:ATP-dependent Clp protease ATP-binding subunit ClpC
LAELLRQKNLQKEDLIWAAKWWDRENLYHHQDNKRRGYGRPGIGWRLLFGYTPKLDQYVTDLTQPQPFASHLIGREAIVSRIERVLSGGSSVFIIGQPGVGKKTTVLEFARRAAEGELDRNLVYARVLEFNYNPILAESSDVNVKKEKLAYLLKEAAFSGNVILVIRDLHRLTNSEVEGYDFTDVFTPFWEKKKLRVIAITTSVDYERFLAPDARLKKYFAAVEVVPHNKNEALLIAMEAAGRWEKEKKIVITVPALRRIVDGSDQYITDIPFPEKALELLDEVVIFRKKQGGGAVIKEDADQILSEKTGISLTSLTQEDKDRLSNLEEIIHERLINQEAAVSLIAQSLRGRNLGARDENRPVGSFLFLGPTGVGKTQTAKVLARVYFGSEKNILRFDMAEFAGGEGISRLIGSLSKNRPGKLTTAIKNNPASLLLLDEIEKAPDEIINLFLSLLDEGVITDAFGHRINCRHLFVIATSNAAGEYIREIVSDGVGGEKLRKMVVEYVQQQRIFSPEFLNRFDGVVVYEPLKREHLVAIARLLLQELADNLKRRNIYLEITDKLCQKLAEDGYDPSFGARPMRRIIDLTLTDLLSKAVLNSQIKSGDRVEIIPGEKKGEYSWRKID